MKITKKELKPVLVLGAICLVVALLIAGVNMITAPKVAADKEKAVQESLEKVMPGGSFELKTDAYNIENTTVTAVYENTNEDGGWVVTLSTSKGYTGNAILLTIGIDANGTVTGAVVTSNPESKETGKTDSYFAGFEKKDAFGIDAIAKDSPELVTGVTYSTTAVRNAAYDAFVVLGFKVPEAAPAPQVGAFTGWSIAGIVIAVLAIGGTVAYIIVKRRKGI
jgi:Na+-translocating ferredoxin:NAD+ oxidoreductase RnfG subunit